jgi:hypothetical protein
MWRLGVYRNMDGSRGTAMTGPTGPLPVLNRNTMNTIYLIVSIGLFIAAVVIGKEWLGPFLRSHIAIGKGWMIGIW